MTSPRDEIDEWLGGEVTPLYPPSGSLDRIRRRARRRKARQTMMTAGGCAVVIVAAVTVPQLIAGSRPSAGRIPQVSVSQQRPSIQPTSRPAGTSTGNALGRARQLRQRTTLSHSFTVPPPHFKPTSVTFVGNGSGGFVGAVIGQAGTPGHCATTDCTSLAGTKDYGKSWYGVSAPVTPGLQSNSGVSLLRFADVNHGWAFGPGLYETSGGGWPWHRQDTNGLQVTDLEAVGKRAFAVFAQCSGTSQDFASNCTSFSLYTSVVGQTAGNAWTAVNVPTPFRQMSTGSASAATLVISAGTNGYLLTPSGQVLRGSVAGGAWTLAGTAPCKPGAPSAAGEQAGAQFAAGGSAASPELLLTCEGQPGASQAPPQFYTSSDGGTWTLVGAVPATGTPTSLASAASGQAVLATAAGISYSADGGKTWRSATFTGNAPAGGFSYVGMTNDKHGVAVPADSGQGEIYITTDGGRTWAASPIAG